MPLKLLTDCPRSLRLRQQPLIKETLPLIPYSLHQPD
jgi:hypothetical protein